MAQLAVDVIVPLGEESLACKQGVNGFRSVSSSSIARSWVVVACKQCVSCPFLNNGLNWSNRLINKIYLL